MSPAQYNPHSRYPFADNLINCNYTRLVERNSFKTISRSWNSVTLVGRVISMSHGIISMNAIMLIG